MTLTQRSRQRVTRAAGFTVRTRAMTGCYAVMSIDMTAEVVTPTVPHTFNRYKPILWTKLQHTCPKVRNWRARDRVQGSHNRNGVTTYLHTAAAVGTIRRTRCLCPESPPLALATRCSRPMRFDDPVFRQFLHSAVHCLGANMSLCDDTIIPETLYDADGASRRG